jgi:hypothetical protein
MRIPDKRCENCANWQSPGPIEVGMVGMVIHEGGCPLYGAKDGWAVITKAEDSCMKWKAKE